MLLPRIIAYEGPLIILTGSQEKRGSPLIRACPLIRFEYGSSYLNMLNFEPL